MRDCFSYLPDMVISWIFLITSASCTQYSSKLNRSFDFTEKTLELKSKADCKKFWLSLGKIWKFIDMAPPNKVYNLCRRRIILFYIGRLGRQKSMCQISQMIERVREFMWSSRHGHNFRQDKKILSSVFVMTKLFCHDKNFRHQFLWWRNFCHGFSLWQKPCKILCHDENPRRKFSPWRKSMTKFSSSRKFFVMTKNFRRDENFVKENDNGYKVKYTSSLLNLQCVSKTIV